MQSQIVKGQPNSALIDELRQRMPAYEINTIFSSRARETEFIGKRKSDLLPVFIKLHTPSGNRHSGHIAARTEFSLLQSLSSGYMPAALDILRLDIGTAVVFEYLDGLPMPLAFNFKAMRTPVLLTESGLKKTDVDIPCLNTRLRWATLLVNAVAEIHSHGVIHKDIKPDNVIVNLEAQQLWLVDFELSTLLAYEDAALRDESSILVSAAYVSPEQTGRMNRKIDYRSDLYSVGVTLFELFTGRLPFSAKDPVEMIHAHVARKPARLSDCNAQCSDELSEIIDCLLHKNPESRYQSAAALAGDLTQCNPNRLLEKGNLFKPNKGAVSRSMRVPERLLGRDLERKKLFEAYRRVSAGAAEIVWISGESGMGKTALVEEFRRSVFQRGAKESKHTFIKGKFDQFSRALPLAAIGQALESFSQHTVLLTNAEHREWKNCLTEAVGDDGRVLTDIAPSLEKLVGLGPALAPLAADKALIRYEDVICRFFNCLCNPEQPLILFLDDLQWADRLTLQTIELLINTQTNCLLVAAYRDNEIEQGHELSTLIRRFEQEHYKTTMLSLRPFALDTMVDLVFETCGLNQEESNTLAELIFLRTAGNPFFSIQLLKRIVNDTDCFSSDMENEFVVNFDKINDVAVTNDVVELMSQRLLDQSKETQHVLGIAACIGSRFYHREIIKLAELPSAAVAQALLEALQAGLIVPLTLGCGQPDLDDPQIRSESNFRFLHDRVQQAASEALGDELCNGIHFQIAKLWWSDGALKHEDKRLFELTSQLNRGSRSVDYREDESNWRVRRASANFKAGSRAKNGGALDSAYAFYKQGIETLGETGWIEHRDLLFKLHLGIAESLAGQGSIDAADQVLNVALEHTVSTLEQAIVIRMLATHSQIQGKNADAIKLLGQILPELGCAVPDNDQAAEQDLLDEIDSIHNYVNRSGIESILTLPVCEDPLLDESLRLLQLQFYAGWRGGKTTLGLLGLARMASVTLRRGNCEMSPFGLVGFGLVAVVRLKDYELAYQFGDTAVRLCEKFQNPTVEGMTNYLFAADVMGWTRPLHETMPFYETAARAGLAALDNLTVGFMMQQSAAEQFAFGRNLQDLSITAEGHIQYLGNIGNVDNLNAIKIGVTQPIANLTGVTSSQYSLDDESFNEAEFLEQYKDKPYHLAWHACARMRIAAFWNHQDQFAHLVDQLNLIEGKIPSHANKIPACNLYCGLMHLHLARSASNPDTSHHIVAVQDICAKLKIWAEAAPDNVRHQYLLLSAELAGFRDEFKLAMDYYDEAIRCAHSSHYWHEAGLANEHAARFFERLGKQKIAQLYWAQAYDNYRFWGATAKAAHIKDAKGISADTLDSHQRGNASSFVDSKITGNLNQVFDVRAALRATESLSGTLDIESLLSQTVEILCENSGAQCCFGYRCVSDEWQLLVASEGDTVEFFNEGHSEIADTSAVQLSAALRYVAQSQAPLLIDQENKVPEILADSWSETFQNHLFLPGINQGQVVAIFLLTNNLADRVFEYNRFPMLQFLSAQVAVSLKNSLLMAELDDYLRNLEKIVDERTNELRKANEALAAKALVDSLTEVYNRHYFDNQLQTLISDPANSGANLSIFMIDVDYFKQFNDRYGHPSGDSCLRAIAEALNSCIFPPQNFVARYGGEEFIVVFVNHAVDKVESTAEKLLQSVRALQITHKDSPARIVTISLGGSTRQIHGEIDTAALIRVADEALYSAKRRGRNQAALVNMDSL